MRSKRRMAFGRRRRLDDAAEWIKVNEVPQKAITGGPSSTRHKLSDPFPAREPKLAAAVPSY